MHPRNQTVKLGSRQSYQPLTVCFYHAVPAGGHPKAGCDSGAYLSTLAHLHSGRKHVAVLSVRPKRASQVLSVSANIEMCCQYKNGLWAENALHSCCRNVVMGRALSQDTLEVLIMVWYLCLSNAALFVYRDPASLAVGHTPHHMLHRGRKFEVQTHSGL